MSSKVGAKDPSADEEFLSQLYKGGELLAAGKVVEAKDHLEKAFKLHPRNEKAQNLLGLTYFKLGLFDRAAEIYELLVRENPADPTLRVNLGLVYLKTNNLTRAVKEFETSTDLDPEHKKAHNYLGLALAQSGDYAKAREHFVVAGSDAMAEKMARALSAPPPATVTPDESPAAAPLAVAEAQPPTIEVVEEEATVIVSAQINEVGASDAGHLEVMTDEEVPPDSEVISADDLLVRVRPGAPDATEGPGAAALVAQAQSLGGADKPPLPAPGFEGVPPAAPTLEAVLSNDWGAQFAAPEPSGPASDDEMRFAEDEGPPAIPMPDAPDRQAQPTSEAAVATGVQVPIESLPQGEATWDSMPVVEAEEVMLEVAPRPSSPADGGMKVTVGWGDEVPASAPDEGAVVDMFPSGDAPAEAQAVEAEGRSAPPEATDDSWGQGPAQPLSAEDPAWLTTAPADEPVPTEGYAVNVEPPSADETSFAEVSNDPAYAEAAADQGDAPEAGSWNQQPPADDVGYSETGEAHTTAEPPSGFSAMNAPRLEELGPSLDWSQGERLPGPFNLNAEGLALSIEGELLARLPGLLAVAGTVDAAPEFKRSRGRATEQPFGEGPLQLQRVKGQGVVYLDPGQASYQAIDLADEGAYIREERVFAFEESVGFENARLNGPGDISVDVVHLKGQGKVLLKLDGALKAMAIPSGTPLKVPLARLVGWYGQISVRVMGFVGQGAVELTGDGYALLAA